MQDFPIETQIGIFNNEEDIEKWMVTQEDSQILAVDYMTFIRHSPPIYTEEIGEYLMRYKLLKEYRLNSYSNMVDELPAKWVDILNIIDSEVSKAMRTKNDH